MRLPARCSVSRVSERVGEDGAAGVGVDSFLAVFWYGGSGEQIPLCLYCPEERGEVGADGCSAGAARFDVACAPAADLLRRRAVMTGR